MDYQRKSPLDYKDISENLRNPAWYDLENDTNLLDDAATAITDLLARAETAEKRTEEAETENKDREEASFREHADTHYWRDRARAAEADNKKLLDAMMHIRKTEIPQKCKVVYEMEFSNALDHERVSNIAAMVFRGLMEADIKRRGKKEE